MFEYLLTRQRLLALTRRIGSQIRMVAGLGLNQRGRAQAFVCVSKCGPGQFRKVYIMKLSHLRGSLQVKPRRGTIELAHRHAPGAHNFRVAPDLSIVAA